MDKHFSDQLNGLRQSESLAVECAFQRIRDNATGHEQEIIAALDVERDPVVRSYLVALLGETGSQVAFESLTRSLNDVDVSVRYWAQYGLQRITGKAIGDSRTGAGEQVPDLFVCPVRWRAYLAVWTFGLIVWVTALIGVGITMGFAGWPYGQMTPERWLVSLSAFTLFSVVMSLIFGEMTRASLKIVVRAAHVEGPESLWRSTRTNRVPMSAARIEKGHGLSAVRAILGSWRVEGAGSPGIEVAERLYEPMGIAALKRHITEKSQ